MILNAHLLLSILCVVSIASTSAQVTLFGALSNFDAVNDCGQPAHGFEIEMQGVNTVTYTFPTRYGSGVKVPITGGIVVRWASGYDSVNQRFTMSTPPRDPAQPITEARDVTWASALVEHCIGTLLREAERLVADTPAHSRIKKVLEVIRKAGRISRSAFVRKTQFLSTAEREDAIAMRHGRPVPAPAQDRRRSLA